MKPGKKNPFLPFCPPATTITVSFASAVAAVPFVSASRSGTIVQPLLSTKLVKAAASGVPTLQSKPLMRPSALDTHSAPLLIERVCFVPEGGADRGNWIKVPW